ncbi:universal stress protein [Gaetbulibacter sp. M240]|uniref:universal stress protein n=1 Tax=Gaetbulibacter sp. M240 TaxID=3126511 RepID=UPI00374F1225
MKNILLPTDFSENSWNAIKYAIQLFENEPCNFYVLHVNKVTDNFMDGAPFLADEDLLLEVYTKPTKKKLRQIMKRISAHFPPNKDHKFYTLSDYNFFIDTIRKQVDEKRIDLIIMGTKGTSGLKEIIVGSNTGDVITKVKCNTLVVPEQAEFKPLKEIAFPTDFSLNYNLELLEPISDIIDQQKAALRIIHVHKKKMDLNNEQKLNRELLDDYFNGTEHSFHYLTNSRIEDAIECFVQSRHVDLISMVAKNLNYFQQILFHSRVEEISYHTETPFLVLHEK